MENNVPENKEPGNEKSENKEEKWEKIENEEADLPIIIDIGSSEIKAGFSERGEPQIKFKSQIGEPKYKKIIRTIKTKEQYIGDECEPILSALSLRYPIKHGIFSNSDDIEPIFNYIFSSLNLTIDNLPEHPLLITEPINNPYKNREDISTILFEKYGIKKLIFASQPILSLYSNSTTTGVVLESGEGVTQSCVVYDGYAIPNSYERYNYGGGDVTKFFHTLLKNLGKYLDSSSEYQIAQQKKEEYCYVKPVDERYNYEESTEQSKVACEFNDGTKVLLGKERILPFEILFNPEMMGMEYPSLPKIIWNSINKTDIELQPKLIRSIILAGGNHLAKGIEKKILHELKKLFKLDYSDINIKLPERPDLSCWKGGSIISSMDIIKKMWITKEEWDEKGTEIIHIKTI